MARKFVFFRFSQWSNAQLCLGVTILVHGLYLICLLNESLGLIHPHPSRTHSSSPQRKWLNESSDAWKLPGVKILGILSPVSFWKPGMKRAFCAADRPTRERTPQVDLAHGGMRTALLDDQSCYLARQRPWVPLPFLGNNRNDYCTQGLQPNLMLH